MKNESLATQHIIDAYEKNNGVAFEYNQELTEPADEVREHSWEVENDNTTQ